MCKIKTQILSEKDVAVAAQILKSGGLVAIPTETVYGLAADALNETAVKKIFAAKGRPSDNPLIVHISEVDEIYNLVSEFTKEAQKLADAFWPGPLTMILKKSSAIPNIISGGLDSVAIRLPDNVVARKIIKEAGCPLAAPSANLSGSPSPTKAEHVISDLFGKIDAIIDSGICNIGVESTVISLCTEIPKILRPGAITLRQLQNILGEVDVDAAVLNKLDENAQPLSPGMKYKHYAPKAKVIILNGSREKYINYVNDHASNTVAALCYDEDVKDLKTAVITFGRENDLNSQAEKLFNALREIDKMSNIDVVYSRCPAKEGIGLAVYNRLIRAAGFDIINL